MRLTAAGREGLSNGEVTNLVANDAQKLFEVTLNAHLVWSSPLQIAVVCALLIEYTGPTALIGVGCLVGVLPLAKVIVKRMLELRTKRLALTDERVRITARSQLCLCEQCAQRYHGGRSECPMCRHKVKRVQRVYQTT